MGGARYTQAQVTGYDSTLLLIMIVMIIIINGLIRILTRYDVNTNARRNENDIYSYLV